MRPMVQGQLKWNNMHNKNANASNKVKYSPVLPPNLITSLGSPPFENCLFGEFGQDPRGRNGVPMFPQPFVTHSYLGCPMVPSKMVGDHIGGRGPT